jgi:hypothetical protein
MTYVVIMFARATKDFGSLYGKVYVHGETAVMPLSERIAVRV